MSSRRLRQFDLLLPFARPPAELANDLLKPLQLPALSTLLGRSDASKLSDQETGDDLIARSLPYERWASQLLLETGNSLPNTPDNSPPVAAALMRGCGLAPTAGYWFVVQPVHLHIARDHLVLTDTRQLAVSEADGQPLFDSARMLAEEAGHELRYGKANLWFLRADDWHALQTATPDAAAGHNIDIWIPRGGGERAWRKLQNEVQMHWMQEDLNRNREARGLPPLNSLWLWGGTEVTPASSATLHPGPAPYDKLFNFSGWMAAAATAAAAAGESPEHLQAGAANAALSASAARNLVMLDQLLAPALAGDWATWQAALQALETDWFAPLLAALKMGTVTGISLLPSDARHLTRHDSTRWSTRRFWRQPSLRPLYS